MSVSDSGPQECSFSFSKKPIDTPLAIHSTISEYLVNKPTHKDYLPGISQNEGNTDLSKRLNISVNSANAVSEKEVRKGQKNYNNINYDEQIRAPRFNLFNQVNLSGDHIQRSYSFSYKEDDKKDNEDDKEDPQAPQSVYVPANFDLNNYTYSGSIVDDTVFTSNKNTNLNEAINNLNENLTTFEREDHDDSNLLISGTQDLEAPKKFVKPVYQYRRPLSVPAVLRPPQDAGITSSLTSSNDSSGTSLTTSLSNSVKIDLDNLNQKDTMELLMNLENLEERIEPVEPTHEHWKPNKFTNCCMKCFKNFGNFFNMKRRHHCRFCGFLICSNCLFEASHNNETNVTSGSESIFNPRNINLIYLDSKARFVIPIFKNLNFLNINIDSLNKIFKLSKICKNCGEYYLNLLFNLNNLGNPTAFGEVDSELIRNLNELNLPFVIIENPFITKKLTKSDISERKNSFVTSTDWNWSSF